MLHHPTIEKLQQLKLFTMAMHLRDQRDHPAIESQCFEERLGLLADIEMTARATKRLEARLRKGKLKHAACSHDIDFQAARGLDKSLLSTLFECEWVSSHLNVLIVGPCGCGKTYIGCALAHDACLKGYQVRYERLPRLLGDLQTSKGDGRYKGFMDQLSKVDVLVLDDFGLVPLSDEHRRDLLEILDDRHEKRSTVVTSQLPVKLWHETIGNGTLADAILDRLVHGAYRIEMRGESMRKLRSKLNGSSSQEMEVKAEAVATV